MEMKTKCINKCYNCGCSVEDEDNYCEECLLEIEIKIKEADIEM